MDMYIVCSMYCTKLSIYQSLLVRRRPAAVGFGARRKEQSLSEEVCGKACTVKYIPIRVFPFMRIHMSHERTERPDQPGSAIRYPRQVDAVHLRRVYRILRSNPCITCTTCMTVYITASNSSVGSHLTDSRA